MNDPMLNEIGNDYVEYLKVDFKKEVMFTCLLCIKNMLLFCPS